LVRIKVRLGQAEAEVEADMEHLQEVIDLIPEVVAKLPAAPHQTVPEPPPQPRAASEAGPKSTIMPVISVEKNDSLAEIISKFFNDPWGRDKRKLSDVREALQSYGLNYPKQSVAVALLRLAKTSTIRRFKAEDGEYVYTTAAVSGALQ
jgi:hypothetical protein